MKLSDKASYIYIKRIKKWIECPVCHKKMLFSKSKTSWVCNNCDYKILEKDFIDDFVFWFCDECSTYLNCQEGFDKKSSKHICQECGYENDTTFDNVKGICVDCGKALANPEAHLCENCKKQRKERAKEWLIKAGKVFGTTVVLIGSAYLALRASDDEDEFENWVSNASHDELSDAYEFERQEWIKNGYNNGTGEKTSKMNRLNDEINKRVADEWENNPNRNRDPNFRWTDANRWDND